MAAVTIQGVGRVFPGLRGGAPTRALEPLDLTIADNEFVALLGPSGCGKSTLLRIVAGLDRATEGQVLVDGRPVARPGPDRGMVFQSYTLFPWLTVRENIGFGPRERGVPDVERRRIADRLMEQVGLSAFADHYPRMLSGGMQQRTALARAPAGDPGLLLLDAPVGARAHQTRAQMQELLLSVWEADRKTVLFVTHDIQEAVFMANRVLVMTARPGRIKTETTIPLPHPRHWRMKMTPEFAAIEEELTEAIREESLRAAAMNA